MIGQVHIRGFNAGVLRPKNSLKLETGSGPTAVVALSDDANNLNEATRSEKDWGRSFLVSVDRSVDLPFYAVR